MESIKSNPLVWIAGALLAALVIGYLLQANAGRPLSGDGAPDGNATTTGAGTSTDSVAAGQTTAKMFMVATGDAGRQGRMIGCEDSLVGVPQSVSAVRPLTEIVTKLLAYESQTYGESGLYNALYQSDVTLASATIENGKATLALSGTVKVAGACDTPRVIEQIRETALQFATVSSVEVLLNGQPIEAALSEK